MSRTRLLHSTLSNIIGAVIPLVLQLATVPLYLKLIGVERYGVLTLVWLLLGYFSLFDLGFGRAIASQIAKLHEASGDARARVFWTGTSLSLLTGALGGLCLLVVGHYLFGDVFNLSTELRSESQHALPWIAAVLPLVTVISALAGALQGRQAFVLLNVGQTVGMLLYQILPLLAAAFVSTAIPWLIAAAIAGRLVTAAILFMACLSEIPTRARPKFSTPAMRAILVYGGWATITGIISPILTIFDRFIIGATAGMNAVAIYSVPFNVVIRLGLFPTGLQNALFPRYAMETEGNLMDLLSKSLRLQSWMMTPIVSFGILAIHPFLLLWVGEISESAGDVGEILLLGLWFNAMGYVPYSLLQSRGRPDVPAKIHLCELLLYVPALWIAVRSWGINGAACAWSLRVALDAFLLLSYTQSLNKSGAAALDLIWVLSAFLWAVFGPSNAIHYYVGAIAFCLAGTAWMFRTMPPDVALLLTRKRSSAFGSKTFEV